MAYRKKTLRTMSPTARKVARLVGEQASIAIRLKNLIPDLQRLDLDSKALETAKSSGLVLSVNDLWGLRDCLYHCRDSGYTTGANLEWANGMLDRIAQYREQLENPTRREEDSRIHKEREMVELPDILSFESTGIPRQEL